MASGEPGLLAKAPCRLHAWLAHPPQRRKRTSNSDVKTPARRKAKKAPARFLARGFPCATKNKSL